MKSPRVTIGLFYYKQEQFVDDSLESVFMQTYRPFRLVICDDGSPDGTRGRIESKLAGCPQGIEVVRTYSDQNVGLARSINRASRHFEGDVVVLMAGDDVSEPQRIERILQAIKGQGSGFGGGFSDVSTIDVSGNFHASGLEPWPHRLILGRDAISLEFAGFLGASTFYHPDVFRKFGEIAAGVLHEDMVLNFRAAILGPALFIPEKLVRYRLHSGNVHSTDGRSASEKRTHVIKIWRSLEKCAEQRCEDLRNAEGVLSGPDVAKLWASCSKWRSTHRMRLAVVQGRAGFRITLLSLIRGRVHRAPVLRSIWRRLTWSVLMLFENFTLRANRDR